ncbi:N-6 DNA methylase [uncultured Desulfovibrio sp.]|uniref:N-6 DNA methylase n=1 Tax=uncultured Desulfovibrio sp. TaxID=167968 RepID=UPI002805B7DD|nr:N-6 DNA methylase [uncultured Desulfovibrio sp.]
MTPPPGLPGSGAALFPCGLLQPEGAYRFGQDALLLAAFAARTLRERAAGGRASGKGRPRRVAELGTGCGAALLGVALRCPDVRCLGLEREPSLVRAAAANAEALGLGDRVSFCMADLAAPEAWPEPLKEAAPQDLVLANPPWGLPGQGRPSPSPLREAALRGTAINGNGGNGGDGDALPVFCAAAARLLRHRGVFCCIAAAGALTRICAALDGARLGLRRILPLRSQTRAPSRRLLLLAQKDAAADVELLAPLTLHGRAAAEPGSGKRPRWTRAALAFCPWLAHSGTTPAAWRASPRGTP